MQGVGNKDDGILVLGATNLPWSLGAFLSSVSSWFAHQFTDPAMRRRFEKRIYIPLPEAMARTKLFRLNVGDTPNDLEESDYKELGKRSQGFSGSDIAATVQEALMMPVREIVAAQFFRLDEEGFYNPIMAYPPCPFCPMKLKGYVDAVVG